MSSVVDSIPDFSSDDEIVEKLTAMYQEADPLRTGQVRATALVSAFAKVLNHPAVDKWKLGELRTTLDPKSDDVPVLKDHFTRSALLWLKSILEDPGAEMNSTYIKTPKGWPPRSRGAHFLSRVESNASSLGLLNVSDINGGLDATFGSLNGTGSFGQFEIPKSDDDVEEIKTMQKRLSDEKFNKETLRNQLEEVEEENDELKKQIEQLKQELAEAKKIIQENNERNKRVEKINNDVITEDEEKAENKQKVQEILRQMKEAQEELTKTKLREKEALDMADELKLKIQSLEGNEETQNNEKTKIKELTSIRERLEEEIQQLQMDCSFLHDQAGSNNRSFGANGKAGGGRIIGSLLEDVSFDQVDEDSPAKAGNLFQLPSAHSTPFFRRNLSPKVASIGEEFRKMGMGRRGLPFCGKSNGSLEEPKAKVVKTSDVGVQTEQQKGRRSLKSLFKWVRENRDQFKFPRYKSFKDLSDDVKIIWNEFQGKRLLKTLAKVIFGLLALSFLLTIFFTFFGAVNINGRTLYPSTWTPQIGPFQMPRPYEFLAVRYHPVY